MTIRDRNVQRRGGPRPGLEDLERELLRLVPAAVPAGLRERVLDQAAEARKSAALSPAMRILAAACSIAIVAVLGLDPLIRKHETVRLAALLDGRRMSLPAADLPSVLAEILSGEGNAAELMARLRIQAASAVREGRDHQVTEAWKKLKGWLDNETSEDLI